jgi:hypothetical protein
MADTAPVDSGYIAGLPMQVKNKILLGILITTPIAAFIAIIDQLALHGQVRDFMAMDPRRIAYWVAILTVPHIIASLITFFDGEYVRYYKRPLIKGAVIAVLLGMALPVVLGPAVLLIAMAFYTMYHNLMQQYGISLMMMRQQPTRDFQFWRWMTIIPAGLAYTVLMTSFLPFVRENWNMFVSIIGVILAIATIFGVRFVFTILRNPHHTRIGLTYFLSNMAMLYVCFGLIATGYGFMATLVPRIIHDLTAFLIYSVHDQNRNARSVRNLVYYIPGKLGIAPALLCLPIGVAISYMLMEVAHNLYIVTLFVTALNFMHYYMEGHMWKRGTPHRQHTPFV